MSDDTARPVRIAMIATGRIAGNALAPAIHRATGAELWSVLSRDAGCALDYAERRRAASPEPAYTGLDALFADPDLDAVPIADAAIVGSPAVDSADHVDHVTDSRRKRPGNTK